MTVKLLTPILPVTFVVIVATIYFLFSDYQNHIDDIRRETTSLTSRIQEYVAQTQENNEQLVKLLRNKWNVIDGLSARNLDFLISEIQPYHDTLRYDLVRIYAPDGELIASGDNPGLFGLRDVLSDQLRTTADRETIDRMVVEFGGNILVASISPINNNYGSVGFIAAGRLITPDTLKQLYPESDVAVDAILNGNIVVRSGKDGRDRSTNGWRHTDVSIPPNDIGTSPFTVTIAEDVSLVQWEYRSSLVLLLFIFGVLGAAVIVVSKKLLALSTQLERSRREIAERDLQNSQSQIRLLLDSTAEAIFGIDNSGNCTFVNQSCLDMLGYRHASDLLGRNMHDLIHSRYADGTHYPAEHCPIVKTFLENKRVNVDDEVLWRKDGSSFAAEYWSHPILRDGECIGAVVTFLDVTERVEALRALQDREQNLAVTLNSIGDAVITTDATGHVTRMNPTAERLTGWSFIDAQTQSLKTVFPIVNAATREPIENPVDKVIATGETVFLSNHTTLIAKDGTEYQIADSAAPILDDGRIFGMVLVFNDVTEQYRLREAAAKHKRDLQAFMDHSPATIYIKDTDGRYLFVNRCYEQLFHIRRELIIGKTDHDVFPKEVADMFQRNDKTVLSAGHALEVEEITPHEDGHHTYVSTKFPLFNEDNEIYAVCGISTDITERKQQEELLRRGQKMEALGKLTGGIAHDYNNLLGIILGYAEQLSQHLPRDARLEKYVRDIQRAAERGANLTRRLLAFSRHRAPDTTVLNINSLLRDQQQMLEKTLTVRIKLVLNLTDDLWPVKLDGGDLEDAIVNMSINAMHAMKDGGELTFRTNNEQLDAIDAEPLRLLPGDYVLLSITDTGCGMDKATKERIFDPFFTTKGEQGTGLGLSQVYGFVERSGGAIKVYSEPGHGSRFSLYFPACHQAISEPSTPSPDSARDLTGTETLLVVDDEQAMVEFAHDILIAQGYRVLTANSGEQALAVLQDERVDLIISDVIMPDMDGYKLAAQVQRTYPQVKLQMVTGFNDNRHHGMTSDALFNNILHKPYASKVLLTRVRNLLDLGKTDIGLANRSILVVDDDADVRALFKLNIEKLGCKTVLACDAVEALTLYRQSLDNGAPFDAVILDLSLPGGENGKVVADKLRAIDPLAKLIVSSGYSTAPEMTHFKDYGFSGAIEKNFDRENIKQVLGSVLSTSLC